MVEPPSAGALRNALRNAGQWPTNDKSGQGPRALVSRGLMTWKRPELVSVSRSRVRVCIRLLTAPDFCKADHSQIQRSHWALTREGADPPQRSGCCARAASGHVAAALPSRVMNWRRLRSSMGSPPGTRRASLPQAQDALEAPAGPWGSLNRSEIAAWGGPGVGSHRRTGEQFQLVICQMMRRAPSGERLPNRAKSF
jgi:hypothetical protein